MLYLIRYIYGLDMRINAKSLPYARASVLIHVWLNIDLGKLSINDLSQDPSIKSILTTNISQPAGR